MGSRRAKKTTPTGSTPAACSPSVSSIVEEVVSGGRVVKYHLLTSDPSHTQGTASVFLTQNEGIPMTHPPSDLMYTPLESEVATHELASRALPLSEDSYLKTRARYAGHM